MSNIWGWIDMGQVSTLFTYRSRTAYPANEPSNGAPGGANSQSATPMYLLLDIAAGQDVLSRQRTTPARTGTHLVKSPGRLPNATLSSYLGRQRLCCGAFRTMKNHERHHRRAQAEPYGAARRLS
jgi:hypothetical protein